MKPKNFDKMNINLVFKRDLFRTPAYATNLLLPFIPTHVHTIWECAAGELHISKVLEKAGYNVYSTDLDDTYCEKFNFITDKLENERLNSIHTIITNPPYSIKKQFYYKLLEYNLPFAILINADYSKWIIDAIRVYGCEKIIPTRRINFITPNHKENSSAHFHSLWLTRYFNLGCTETFVDLITKE